jgi:hypothetical protein
VLKAAYFPSVDLLHAELGSHPSQVWRAILEGCDTLQLGLIRRIGDGKTTDPWQQNWLPMDERLRPYAARRRSPPSKVSDFIDTTSATWNSEMLDQHFLPLDVEVIKNIPICTRDSRISGRGTLRRVASSR